MPIALSSREPVEYVLKSDRNKPPAERASFLLRVLTARQSIELQKAINDAIDAEQAGNSAASMEATVKALGLMLAGWKNVEGGFDPARLPDLASFAEMWEIIIDGRASVRLSEEDQKKSVAQSASALETAAQPAPPASPA